MNPHFFTALTDPSVDAEAGTIKRASLISLGDARGHFDKKGRQVIVDEVTLEQIFKQCKKLGTVKVKADHGSGVFEIVGWADNFALTSEKVLADVHFYESEPQRNRLLEIAEKNPTHMGFSMEFQGEDKPRGTVCLARCSEVFAAALVDFAAANTSLFSAPEVEEPEEPETIEQPENKMEDNKPEVTLESLAAMLEDYGKRLTALETPPAEVEEPEETPEPAATDPEDKPADSDPERTYKNPDADIDDEKTKIAEMAAAAAVKKLAGMIGAKGLGKPGTAGADPKTPKHFEEFVADVSASLFSGDQNAARAHILTNKQKYPDAWKAYEAQRQGFHTL